MERPEEIKEPFLLYSIAGFIGFHFVCAWTGFRPKCRYVGEMKRRLALIAFQAGNGVVRRVKPEGDVLTLPNCPARPRVEIRNTAIPSLFTGIYSRQFLPSQVKAYLISIQSIPGVLEIGRSHKDFTCFTRASGCNPNTTTLVAYDNDCTMKLPNFSPKPHIRGVTLRKYCSDIQPIPKE